MPDVNSKRFWLQRFHRTAQHAFITSSGYTSTIILITIVNIRCMKITMLYTIKFILTILTIIFTTSQTRLIFFLVESDPNPPSLNAPTLINWLGFPLRHQGTVSEVLYKETVNRSHYFEMLPKSGLFELFTLWTK